MGNEAECYVDETGQGHFCCPLCGMVRFVSVAKRTLIRNRFADTCACGVEVTVCVFLCPICFDPLQLSASYRVRNRPGQGQILITELNIMEVRFERTGTQKLFPGDYLELTFHLQNAKKTPINLQALVTDVYGMQVVAARGEVYFNAPEPAES